MQIARKTAMNPFFPLVYLRLENDNGSYIIWRDVLATAFLTGLLACPFLWISDANFFHKDGFVDKMGSFTSVLTGFYVAALIAVATLNSRLTSLDELITVGLVRMPSMKADATSGKRPGEMLTRRQYVCYMFGFMAYLALILAIISIAIVILANEIIPKDVQWVIGKSHYILKADCWRAAGIVIYALPIASLAITTIHGLFYLVDRLYAEPAKLLKRSHTK